MLRMYFHYSNSQFQMLRMYFHYSNSQFQMLRMYLAPRTYECESHAPPILPLKLINSGHAGNVFEALLFLAR
jgi:hypothetical protein